MDYLGLHPTFAPGDTLVVLPTLAKLLGLNEAIVLQQVHFWARINAQIEPEDTHFHEGRWWVAHTYEHWQEQFFPFWSVRTVRRVFAGLVEEGYLKRGYFSESPRNRTSWYAIDYGKLNEVL